MFERKGLASEIIDLAAQVASSRAQTKVTLCFQVTTADAANGVVVIEPGL